MVVFGVLILLGSAVGLVAGMIAGRIVGSAGWRSYAVIFAAPLIVATIPWWAGSIGATVTAVALLGGAFIGRYIIYRPMPAPDQPLSSLIGVSSMTDAPRRMPDQNRSIMVPWVEDDRLDQNRSIVGLRLEDAMVDANGTVYGTGTLDFPPGAQQASHSSTAAVSMHSTPDDELIFRACYMHRDDVTGYLVGQPVGPRVVVPEEASSVIRTVLRYESKAPLSFSARSGGAVIYEDRVQGLTDMFGSVQSFGEDDDDGGVVVIQLTASLRVGRNERSHLPASLTREKVSLSFTIQPMTRVVRFGAHTTALPQWPLEAHHSKATELDSMRLATSLIGSVDQSYGRADDGSLVALRQHRSGVPGLTLELGLHEQRDASGLITTRSGGYPRVRFTPMDLDDIAAHIGPDLRFAIERGESKQESIQYTSGSPDGPGISGPITASRLDFEITRAGLVIDWIAHRDGELPPLQGRVTVPWEVLMVRFPRFARYRQQLLAR